MNQNQKIKQKTKKLSNPGSGQKRCPDCGSLNFSSIHLCKNCNFNFKDYNFNKMKNKEKLRIMRSYKTILNKASHISEGKKRSVKGSGFEDLVKSVIKYNWEYILFQDPTRLVIGEKRLYTAPISLMDIKNSLYYQKSPKQIQKIMVQKNKKMKTHLDTDVRVYIDNVLVMGVEVKAYCDMAMFSRVIETFSFLKEEYNEVECCLVQFENALGGNFSILDDKREGSPTVHHHLLTIDKINKNGCPLSPNNIVSLLPGRRNSYAPIHDTSYRKEFSKKVFDKFSDMISGNLKKYIEQK